MKKFKGYLLIAILLLLVSLGCWQVVRTVYTSNVIADFEQKKDETNDDSQITDQFTLPESEMRAYSDKVYGFTFQYPDGWYLDTIHNRMNYGKNFPYQIISIHVNHITDYVETPEEYYGIARDIESQVDFTEYRSQLESDRDEVFGHPVVELKNGQKATLYFDGSEGFELMRQYRLFHGDYLVTLTASIIDSEILINNGFISSVYNEKRGASEFIWDKEQIDQESHVLTSKAPEEMQKYFDYFDQSINTLDLSKFTDEDLTDTWKEYRNDDIGISFSYPALYGEVEEVMEDHTDDSTSYQAGKRINVRFIQEILEFSSNDYGEKKEFNTYADLHFSAYSSDYKGFKQSPFNGSDDIESECPNRLAYNEKGEVCDVREYKDVTAVLKNTFAEDECAFWFGTEVNIPNLIGSIYEGIQFQTFLPDINISIGEAYDPFGNCSDGSGGYTKASELSKNIMHNDNLSNIDQKVFNELEEVVRSIQFFE